jgi:hypothetical protein
MAGRATDFFFVKIGYSPIKLVLISLENRLKKNLEITKSILYINFVNTYTPKNISIKSTLNNIQYSTQLILVLNQYFKKVVKSQSPQDDNFKGNNS